MGAEERDPSDSAASREGSSFENLPEEGRPGLLVEFWEFLKYNKKWWLLPIIVVILLVGLLVLLAGTAAGPFIYPLF